MIGNGYGEANDERMNRLAHEMMETKEVSPEQNAEALSWLILNQLTLQKYVTKMLGIRMKLLYGAVAGLSALVIILLGLNPDKVMLFFR